MIPVKRYSVNKRRSASKFSRDSKTVAKANISAPMRGGWRL